MFSKNPRKDLEFVEVSRKVIHLWGYDVLNGVPLVVLKLLMFKSCVIIGI